MAEKKWDGFLPVCLCYLAHLSGKTMHFVQTPLQQQMNAATKTCQLQMMWIQRLKFRWKQTANTHTVFHHCHFPQSANRRQAYGLRSGRMTNRSHSDCFILIEQLLSFDRSLENNYQLTCWYEPNATIVVKSQFNEIFPGITAESTDSCPIKAFGATDSIHWFFDWMLLHW